MNHLWHPYGNTPSVNLLNNHNAEQGASVLSVASGDLRHILYTCSQLQGKEQPKQLDFFVNDMDPCVIARNLLLVLLLDGTTFQHKSKDSVDLVVALWFSAGISQGHATMLRSALDTLLEKMVVGMPWSCGNVELDAEFAASVREIFCLQVPSPWLEKPETSCMKLDCCRLLGPWNSCVQQYFRTKTLGKCEMKIRNLTWNPTMCHPQRAVIAGSLPFRCYFLRDLTEESRHTPDEGHKVCLGQKMLETGLGQHWTHHLRWCVQCWPRPVSFVWNRFSVFSAPKSY